jgi:hypothetical protein
MNITVIGRFYNGRNHSMVCYGIQRIEALRESDPDIDAVTEENARLSGLIRSKQAHLRRRGCVRILDGISQCPVSSQPSFEHSGQHRNR